MRLSASGRGGLKSPATYSDREMGGKGGTLGRDGVNIGPMNLKLKLVSRGRLDHLRSQGPSPSMVSHGRTNKVT